jgi:hypothetical protein
MMQFNELQSARQLDPSPSGLVLGTNLGTVRKKVPGGSQKTAAIANTRNLPVARMGILISCERRVRKPESRAPPLTTCHGVHQDS